MAARQADGRGGEGRGREKKKEDKITSSGGGQEREEKTEGGHRRDVAYVNRGSIRFAPSLLCP